MVTVILDNYYLILGLIITLSSWILLFVVKKGIIMPEMINVEGVSIGTLFKRPLKSIIHSHKGINWFIKVFLILLMVVLLFTQFIVLERKFTFICGILLFIPATLVIGFIVYSILSALTYLIHRFIDIDAIRFNFSLSLTIIIFILLYLNIYCQGFSLSQVGFCIAVINLIFTFILILNCLRMILLYSFEERKILTIKNVWKITFMIISFFIIIQTSFSYVGLVYFPNAFNYTMDELSLFDMWYHTVITFGTVGYGDISPTNVYTKLISIITVFTSIITVTVLLSSVMHLSKKHN